MDTALQPAVVEADLGFSRPAEVIEDDGSRGLRRAVTRPVDQDFSSQFEYRRCQIRDLCGAGHPQPGLRSMGFETIDLRDREGLQSLLCDVKVAGEISDAQSRQLRRHLLMVELNQLRLDLRLQHTQKALKSLARPLTAYPKVSW